MNLKLPIHLASGYKSKSQIARVVTEAWVKTNLRCPSCESPLTECPPNTKTKDFDCLLCHESFQLKSSANWINGKILGGEYATTLASIMSGNHPSLIILCYDNNSMTVSDIQIIHRLLITQSCIIARKPLSKKARRHDWQGSLIDLSIIPSTARISVVRDSMPVLDSEVRAQWRKIQSVDRIKPQYRGWLADVLWIVEKMGQEFDLKDIYLYENQLKTQHPANQHVRPKIRQQLQVLREMGFLNFFGRGHYVKT